MKCITHRSMTTLVTLAAISLTLALTIAGNSEASEKDFEASADHKSLVAQLNRLPQSNYLVELIMQGDAGISIMLNNKTWNNPKDTKKIVDSVASLMGSLSVPVDFKIRIMRKKFDLYIVSKDKDSVIVTDHYKSEKAKRPKYQKTTAPKRLSPTKSQLRAASHRAIQDNCKCTIIEWTRSTFDHMQAEGNHWETLENFTSKGREGIAKSLCAYVKMNYSPSTGRLSIVEVDYYSPDTCD